MKRTVLVFGLISGAMMAAMMFATMPFIHRLGMNRGLVVGYTAIVLSFMLVFFGVRSYRENIAGGTITFGRAFAVGILIALISSLCYVLAWEVIYFGVPGFAEKFWTLYEAQIRNSGDTPQNIQAQLEQYKNLKPLFDNPLTNAAMVFIEPFPVGLVITLISALILRKRHKPEPGGSPVPAES